MKHLSRLKTATATGAVAALAVGAFGVADGTADAAPIVLVTERGGNDPAATTVQLAADSSPDSADSANSAASSGSAGSATSPVSTNSPASTDSHVSTDSPTSVDPPTSTDSSDDGFPGRFSDVDPDNVHRDNIEELAARGVTSGVTANTFAPDGTVTRGQFASFLARAFGLDPVMGQRFADVDPGSAHATSINAVVDAGFASGVTENAFEPDRQLTRAQLASLLAQALDLELVDGDRFVDVLPGSTHAAAITTVADAGITTGVTDSTFEPNHNLRRDQMASLLIRALDRR